MADDGEVAHLTGTSTKIEIMTGKEIATVEEIVTPTGPLTEMAEEGVILIGDQIGNIGVPEMGETEAGRDTGNAKEAGHALLLDMVPRGPGVQFTSTRGL